MRRGLLGEKGAGAAVYHTKSMHNNNQVRGLRKRAGMQKLCVIAKIKMSENRNAKEGFS